VVEAQRALRDFNRLIGIDKQTRIVAKGAHVAVRNNVPSACITGFHKQQATRSPHNTPPPLLLPCHYSR
jgi:hypothetical protein